MEDSSDNLAAMRREVEALSGASAFEPHWFTVPTPFCAEYRVMGISLQFATNAAVVAEMAEEVFGAWSATPVALEAAPVRLRVWVEEPAETGDTGILPESTFRAQGDTFTISAGASSGFGDRRQGFAVAFLTPAMVQARSRAKTGFLECLGMFLVSQHRRATLHAAAVVHRDRCVLLTGPGGAGKSTLAYACLRSGFGLLSEDIVFAEESGMGVWGSPWQLHLLPDGVRFFPELDEAERITQLNGKTKLRIEVCARFPERAVPYQKVWGICTLGRSGEANSRLHGASPERARQFLTQFKDNPMLDYAAMDQAVDRLLQAQLIHLEVGTDLPQAVETLHTWMEN